MNQAALFSSILCYTIMYMKRKKSIPKSLQPILWSQNVKTLDVDRDKVLIIHHVLAYGSLKDLKWLFLTYSKPRLRRVFLDHPMRVYSPSGLSFAVGPVLHIDARVNPKRYVKATA